MTYVTINRQVIARNVRLGTTDPPIAVRRTKSGKAEYVSKYKFDNGELVYSPHKPILKCGARLVLVIHE